MAVIEGGSLGTYYLMVGLLWMISEMFSTGSTLLLCLLFRVSQGFGGILLMYYDVIIYGPNIYLSILHNILFYSNSLQIYYPPLLFSIVS